MLDRRFVTDNINLVAENCRLRGASVDVGKFAELDLLRRKLQLDIDRLNQEAGRVSKSIGKVSEDEREPLKRECGNAWAFNKNGFLASKSRLFGRIDLCKIKHPREVEIDEPEDLISVGCLMKKL